ncbi:MAG: ATP-binding protein [Candidatus Saccharibacteria bacterium]|nr:ATP-binding protein [Candidatus Saccharibacteria bacterium]
MIKRPLYLNRIIPFIDKPQIKILVGVRRAGKSTLLEYVKELLLEKGKALDSIVHINFDALEYTNVRDKETFLALIKKLYSDGKRYFLLDEVQNIEQWDEVISALFAEKDTDIYITGSNSKLLSTELSTFLTGRYLNIYVSTLNFSEFLDFKKARGEDISNLDETFAEYMERGGFPAIHLSSQSLSQCDQIISDICSSIVLRDLVERHNIRNTDLLNRIIKYIFDNIGNIFSAKSISDHLKAERRNLNPETIYNYLNWLEEALVIKRVSRYDLRGKVILKTQEKFFLTDIGFLYAVNGRGESYKSGILENIVYHELISHGYKVYLGKNDTKEIDFVAEKNHSPIYIQVTSTLDSDETINREFSAFDKITDNYPKYVVSMDKLDAWNKDRNGIKHKYLPKFILEDL